MTKITVNFSIERKLVNDFENCVESNKLNRNRTIEDLLMGFIARTEKNEKVCIKCKAVFSKSVKDKEGGCPQCKYKEQLKNAETDKAKKIIDMERKIRLKKETLENWNDEAWRKDNGFPEDKLALSIDRLNMEILELEDELKILRG